MANMVNINIRMDADLKKEVEKLFNEFGMNMTTAITVFAKMVVRERKLPFEISAEPDDGFYNPYNLAEINERIKRIENGTAKYVVKTIEELEAMTNE